MLSKKQITRAVTFISVSILSGLSSAVSAGLVPDDSHLIEAQAATTEDSSHPVADEYGIKMYKKKKVMYAKCDDSRAYVYTDAEATEENKVNTGCVIYLSSYQKVTVLGEVKGTNWLYIRYRCYNGRDGSFSYEKSFIQKKQLKSKLTQSEKEEIKMIKEMGFKYVEDMQYNGVIFTD